MSDLAGANLDDESRDIVAAEGLLLSTVQRAVVDALATATPRSSFRSSFEALREQTTTANADDLPALFEQMHNLYSQAEAAGIRRLPEHQAPYFAHVRVDLGERVRDLLLGDCTFMVPGTTAAIVDWRTAPLARLFFELEPGEPFEQELPGRIVSGHLLFRRVLHLHKGALVRIDTNGQSLRRDRAGRWSQRSDDDNPRLGAQRARSTATDSADDVWPPDVSSVLDATQRSVLDKDDRRPLLILGGAGSGKTTVALHRLAALRRKDSDRYAPEQMLVVVAERGLARLTRTLLKRLDLAEVRVCAFDTWARQEATRLFPDLPRALRDDAPADVVRFKRHPVLWRSLPTLVEGVGREMARTIDRKLVAEGEVTARFEASQGTTLLERLKATEAACVGGVGRARRNEIGAAFEAERGQLWRSRAWRSHLLGNRPFLREVARASEGQLAEATVERVLERTRLQLSNRSEASLDHVDADRLRAIDGRTLDDGTPLEAARSIDPEDHALLLVLLELATGDIKTPSGRMARYAHMVIDEAQELASIELAVLGRARRSDAGVTIAGDRAQQLDPGASFESWGASLEALGAEGSEAVHLETTYRCTEPVARFAHEVLGGEAPAAMPHAPKSGAAVARSDMRTLGHAAAVLVRGLRDLVERDERARVAVIAQDAESARSWAEVLGWALPVRWVTRGAFTFQPGIDVTDVTQVKGLEFDYVIAPDVSAGRYPDTPLSRRTLHVLATRAIHELWVVTVGAPSEILPGLAGDKRA